VRRLPRAHGARGRRLPRPNLPCSPLTRLAISVVYRYDHHSHADSDRVQSEE